MTFAKAVLSGVLVSDPEKRFTPNNHTVTSFYIAVENAGIKGNAEPFWVKIHCWRQLAEVVSEQLHKNDHILVEGKLVLNSFQAQDGTQKRLFEMDANTVERLSGRPEPMVVQSADGQSTSGQTGQSARGYASAPGGQQQAAVPAMPPSPPPMGLNAQYGAPPSMAVSTAKPFDPMALGGGDEFMTEDDIPF